MVYIWDISKLCNFITTVSTVSHDIRLSVLDNISVLDTEKILEGRFSVTGLVWPGSLFI